MNQPTVQVARALLVFATAGIAAATALVLEEWLGDWVGPVWLLSPFLAAFLIEMALGRRAAGRRGIIIGAVVGVIVVAGPSVGYPLAVASGGEELMTVIDDLDLALLWGLFIPLGALEGGLWGPMGATSGDFLRRKARS